MDYAIKREVDDQNFQNGNQPLTSFFRVDEKPEFECFISSASLLAEDSSTGYPITEVNTTEESTPHVEKEIANIRTKKKRQIEDSGMKTREHQKEIKNLPKRQCLDRTHEKELVKEDRDGKKYEMEYDENIVDNGQSRLNTSS